MAGDLMQRLKQKFATLEPKTRQRALQIGIGGAAIGLLLLMYVGTGQNKKQPPAKPKTFDAIELGDSRLDDDIRATIEKEREEARNRDAAQDATLQQNQQALDRIEAQQKAMTTALQVLTAPPDPATAAAPGKTHTDINDPDSWEHSQPGSSTGPAAPPPEPAYIGGIGMINVSQTTDGSKKNTTAATTTGDKVYLPVGFMPAKVLTGLRAKTVDSASENPEPIILRVQAPAQLPNAVKAELQGCFVVANGFGSLASERVETRLVSLNCLDFDGASIIEQEIKGIVVDDDGVKGLAAHPVTKGGANMARMFMAGLVGGAGDAIKASTQTTYTGATGSATTFDTDKVGLAALGSGVSEASSELAKQYSELVRQAAPVLEMGPGKDVTIVLTQGVWLEIRHNAS